VTTHFRGKKGYRPDLDADFDSKGEANVARVLNHLGISWERGRKIHFEDLAEKYGFDVKWTQPDFYLPHIDVHVEVKPGGLVGPDHIRIALVYLKDEKLEIWGPATLNLFERAFKHVIGDKWE